MTGTAFDLLSEEIRTILHGLGFESVTPVQEEAIPAIMSGKNVLLISPTGTGKTEAALLPVLEMIGRDCNGQGSKAVYITPLRALNRDILKRIEYWAQKLRLTVEIRHGDTPQGARRKQAINPPDILVTTPETLQVMLVGSRIRSNLKSVKHVIVDEIHQFASNRRGSQLSFGLERLEDIADGRIQRIGLSATTNNPIETGRLLCGPKREFRLVDTSRIRKRSEYSVELPVPRREDDLLSRELFVSPYSVARIQRMVDLIQCHERTLIFVNSRTLVEELGSRFGMLGMKVGVHHGSLPREERERVEQEFKDGSIKALVCTSTMELGLDIGAVDLVVQYMSPRQVNSLIQRVGRSGHNLSRKSEGIILAVSPEDALESVVISEEAIAGNSEPTIFQDCPLDVLAHQIAGLLLERGEISEGEIHNISIRSYSFRALSKDSIRYVLRFMEKLGYLSLVESRAIRKRKCREYYFQNLSMIRDEKRYSVVDVTTQKNIGILGEEFMLIHARVGVNFVIKGRVWKIEEIQETLVYVTPTEDPTAAVPGWDGELIAIPESVAMRVGQERRRLEELNRNSSLENIKWNAEKVARDSIFEEINGQSVVSKVPTDRRIVVERYKNYLIIHTSAGDRVNATLGELFEEILLRMGGVIRHWWNDGYRILIELTTEEFETDSLVKKLFHYDDSVHGFLNAVIRKHFPFGYEMKFIAERFGALKRGSFLSSDQMRELIVKFRFTPIYDETLRESLSTKIDVERSIEILRDCERHHVEIAVVATQNHGPLARYILSRYADTDYSEDAITSFDSMKSAIAKELVSLLCFKCGNLKEYVRVGDLAEMPVCKNCGSSLLAVLFYGGRFAANSYLKRKSGQKVTTEEIKALSSARRSADVVLAYGRRGVVAQSVYGIGPQTASRILSRMHESEEDFYKDLLEAKLKFIQTKKYWD